MKVRQPLRRAVVVANEAERAAISELSDLVTAELNVHELDFVSEEGELVKYTVKPNYRALEGKTAWIAGMRRDQSKTRTDIGLVEWDAKFDLVKINPVAAWTENQIWSYIMANGVPYNELHDKSYPSIGCTYCTKPVAKGADPRSGRWQGFDKEECGIQEGSITILEHEGKI